LTRKTALAIYLLLAALLALLAYPAGVWLVRSWLTNPYYTHGFLIPPLTALLIWGQWRTLAAVPRQGGSWLGLVAAAVLLGVALWAQSWQNYAVVLWAVIGLAAALVLYLEGWPRLRLLFFPLLFLALAVPLPIVDRASPWFEAFTARWATGLAQRVGIQAQQMGGEIALPNTTVVVGAPCSGLRSLVTMITLAVGWIYIVQGRWWAKLILLVAVVPLAALANVLRVGLLLVVAQVWGADAALTYYHDWSSPILFLTALGLLLLAGRLLQCHRIRDDFF